MTQHNEPISDISPEGPGEMPAMAAPHPKETLWLVIRHAAALYALIAFGSAIGGVLRAIVSLAVWTEAGPDFPWGTLFVNVTGSFVVGFYATLTGPGGRLFAGSHRRQFVMTGICGGYTTFSVFSLETLSLVQAGYLTLAGLNVGVSTIGWLAAVWLGHILAASLNRLKGS